MKTQRGKASAASGPEPRRAGRVFGGASILALLAGGCTAVLGIDKDYYLDGQGGAGGGADGGGGAGADGGGGAGGTTTSITTSSGTTTSSTTSGACDPGETSVCYSGPAGTEGVGSCTAGIRTCAGDGMGFGPCQGEVLPAPEEVCDGAADDDCDGVPDAEDGCVCEPGVVEACYTGPAGTEGMIPCQPGTRTCDPDGKAWGTCKGEVTPLAEVCFTLVDESCDGQAGCTGEHLWSKRFGSSTFQFARSVAADKANNVLVAGSFSGLVDFGSGLLSGQDAIFVTKLSPAGDPVWSKNIGQFSSNRFPVVRADGSGNVVVAGGFEGTLDFGGGGVLASVQKTDAFVAKLDPSGNHLWSKRFGEAEHQSASALAIDGDGNVLVAGTFEGLVDFGGGPLSGKLFVAKLGPSGEHLWSKAFSVTGGSSVLDVRGIGADALGNVVFGGSLNGTANLGGQDLASASTDVYVAKLGPGGQHIWSKHFGSAGPELSGGLGLDGEGNIVLTGTYFSPLAFGGAPIEAKNGGDVFAAKLDPSGNHVWSKGFGDGGAQSGDHVAVDSSGNVVLSGFFEGSPHFGGPPLSAAGALGGTFVAKLDPSGDHVWSKGLGESKVDSSVEGGVAVDTSGNVLFAGGLSGSMSLGGAVLVSAGGWDVVVAKFAQ